MAKETIFTLIIIAVVLSSTIGLVFFFLLRKAKYEQFVLSHSESIKKIDQLNTNYAFKAFRTDISFYHRFDNKGYWYKTEPIAFLSREIRNDLEAWFKLRSDIEFNRQLLKEYKADIKNIESTISPDVCASEKMKHKKCVKIETSVFSKKIQDPNTDITVTVRLRYVSRKGKVDLMKSGKFGYVEIIRILDSVSTSRVDRKTYERLATAERAMLSDSMRYDVLKRDGFRCVLCGMSSKDGAILHVDHIIPVSKGGKSVLSNLRTLCEKCNIGKSNKIE